MAMTLGLQRAGGFPSLPQMSWMITPWFLDMMFHQIFLWRIIYEYIGQFLFLFFPI